MRNYKYMTREIVKYKGRMRISTSGLCISVNLFSALNNVLIFGKMYDEKHVNKFFMVTYHKNPRYKRRTGI